MYNVDAVHTLNIRQLHTQRLSTNKYRAIILLCKKYLSKNNFLNPIIIGAKFGKNPSL